MRLRRLTLTIALATGLLSLSAIGAGAGAGKTAFTQTNLVSNRADQGAGVIDPSLQNPWGISASSTSPMWVSDNGAGVTTLYRGDGSKVPLTVVIPPGAGSGEAQGTPTGTVFNGNMAEFRGDRFLFATEDGTLAGWQPAFGGVARTEVDNSLPAPGAVYKGLALGSTTTGDRLYAANFRGGAIDVFDSSYNPAGSLPIQRSRRTTRPSTSRTSAASSMSPSPCGTPPATTTWPAKGTVSSTPSTSTAT